MDDLTDILAESIRQGSFSVRLERIVGWRGTVHSYEVLSVPTDFPERNRLGQAYGELGDRDNSSEVFAALLRAQLRTVSQQLPGNQSFSVNASASLFNSELHYDAYYSALRDELNGRGRRMTIELHEARRLTREGAERLLMLCDRLHLAGVDIDDLGDGNHNILEQACLVYMVDLYQMLKQVLTRVKLVSSLSESIGEDGSCAAEAIKLFDDYCKKLPLTIEHYRTEPVWHGAVRQAINGRLMEEVHFQVRS